jgi:two-component system cell cycle response regulator
MDTPRRIMLVDGSDATRKMVGQLLRKQLKDVEVVCFHTAREALGTLKLEHFDLISTALALPDMDGMAFTDELRKIGGHESTPVIVVSGDAAGLKGGEDSEVTAFFDKSRGIKALVEFIADHLPAGNGGSAGTMPENPRVLYVEDSLTAAMAVKRILGKHGVEAVHVMTAEEALELLQGSEPFDLLVSDLFLPGRMSGADLVRQIRHGLKLDGQALPILMITVDGSGEAEYRKLLDSGANDYVTKPLAEATFVDKLTTLLSATA